MAPGRLAIWKYLPVVGGVAVLLVFVGLFYRTAIGHTDGAFCYPLDDTFIHMAIGRNIARHATFGVVPKVFAGAASSLAWPILLALADLVAGDRVLTPLILNAVFGVLVVWVLARAFEREAPTSSPFVRFSWIAATVILTPLPTVVYTGMEHTGHILVMLLLVLEAARWLSGDDDHKPPWKLIALATLATSFRYESMFAAGIIAGLALLRRRYRAAAMLVLVPMIPITLFGIYSMAHGGLFLPTSVVVKGNRIHFHDITDVGDALGGDFVQRMAIEPHMMATLAVTAIMLVVALSREGLWSQHSLRIGIALFAGIAHNEFASLNWFFRYEAYVVALSLASVGLYCAELVPSLWGLVTTRKLGPPITVAVIVATALSLAVLGRRAMFAAEQSPSASRNIYDQQVQNARFLGKYFPGEAVAVNDIGAVAYFGELPLVDLGGLATLEVARAKQLDFFIPPSAEAIARLTSKADVAIVYDSWFPNSLPKTWLLAGRWQLDWCRVCSSPIVSIYATRPETFERVVTALRDFAPELPADVRQVGRYVAHPASGDAASFDEGDVLRVDAAFASSTLRRRYSYVVVVGPDGRFPYTNSEPVAARGRTLEQIGEALRTDFDGFIRTKDHDLKEPTPKVDVTIVRRTATHYTVVGNVFSPTDFWCDEPRTASRALALAGGRDFASTNATPFILHERDDGHFERIPFDPASNEGPLVAPHDVVYVP